VVKRKIAERAGITKLIETKIWAWGTKAERMPTSGSPDRSGLGSWNSRTAGGGHESRSVAEEDGLIGTDVFEDFLVEIDFPGEKLSELPNGRASRSTTVLEK